MNIASVFVKKLSKYLTQESLPVGCKPPTSPQYVLNIHVLTCLGGLYLDVILGNKSLHVLSKGAALLKAVGC